MRLIYAATRGMPPLPEIVSDDDYCQNDPDDCECGEYHAQSDSDTNGLYEHDYNVLDHFKITINESDVTPHLLGVELELECHGSPSDVRDGFFKAHDEAPYFIGKYDGSLDNGIEMVTLPLSREQHEKTATAHALHWWPTMRARSTCGMHIHIAKEAFNHTEHQIRFAHFFSKHAARPRLSQAWIDFLDVLLRRSENTYCNRGLTGIHMKTSGDKYQSVNFRNDDTLEVRGFAATRNVKVYMANVELVLAVHKLSIAENAHELKSPWHFIECITKYAASDYPYLAARLALAESDAGNDMFRRWHGEAPAWLEEVLSRPHEPVPEVDEYAMLDQEPDPIEEASMLDDCDCLSCTRRRLARPAVSPEYIAQLPTQDDETPIAELNFQELIEHVAGGVVASRRASEVYNAGPELHYHIPEWVDTNTALRDAGRVI